MSETPVAEELAHFSPPNALQFREIGVNGSSTFLLAGPLFLAPHLTSAYLGEVGAGLIDKGSVEFTSSLCRQVLALHATPCCRLPKLLLLLLPLQRGGLFHLDEEVLGQVLPPLVSREGIRILRLATDVGDLAEHFLKCLRLQI